MSGIASQVILHPTASQTLKLWSTTVGRDKVSKLLLVADTRLHHIMILADLPNSAILF